jgi:hypothetical protein
MTKKQARAILVCSERLRKAVNSCLDQLPTADREHAEAYWAGHVKNIASGNGYGSMPVARANDVLGGYEV